LFFKCSTPFIDKSLTGCRYNVCFFAQVVHLDTEQIL
jgi:hypothetical protein